MPPNPLEGTDKLTHDLAEFFRSQLQREIAAMEKYFMDTEGTLGTHKATLANNFQKFKQELSSRRSTGKRFDAAETRLKASHSYTSCAGPP